MLIGFDLLDTLYCNFDLFCYFIDVNHMRMSDGMNKAITYLLTYFTRSSAVVTLQRPSNPSRLKITDRSFYHQAPLLSGIHCPNFCVLFLQHHLLKPTTLSSHCLPLNSTNNWKPIFSFNPILPRLSPLRTDTLELDSALIYRRLVLPIWTVSLAWCILSWWLPWLANSLNKKSVWYIAPGLWKMSPIYSNGRHYYH